MAAKAGRTCRPHPEGGVRSRAPRAAGWLAPGFPGGPATGTVRPRTGLPCMRRRSRCPPSLACLRRHRTLLPRPWALEVLRSSGWHPAVSPSVAPRAFLTPTTRCKEMSFVGLNIRRLTTKIQTSTSFQSQRRPSCTDHPAARVRRSKPLWGSAPAPLLSPGSQGLLTALTRDPTPRGLRGPVPESHYRIKLGGIATSSSQGAPFPEGHRGSVATRAQG